MHRHCSRSIQNVAEMSGQFDFGWLRFYLFFIDSDSRTYFKFNVTVKYVYVSVCVCVCVCVCVFHCMREMCENSEFNVEESKPNIIFLAVNNGDNGN